jgi:hypothetical protein
MSNSTIPRPIAKTLEERFLLKVQAQGECTVWTGALNSAGYGNFRRGSANVLAHRFAWERAYGEIPIGYSLDHKCFNRKCVNVDHLRLATKKQNMEHLSQVTAASGFRGVIKSGSRWRGHVKHNGIVYSSGQHDTPEEANEATIELRNKLFTHNLLDR